MNRIFLILLAALTFFFGADVANSVLAELGGDAEKVAYYLQDNIYVLNYMDEQMEYDGDIEAITNIQKVTVKNDHETYYAYLCEFANDEGYMLLADDYVLLDYVRDAANPYKGIVSEEYIYNQLTNGYLYRTAEGRVLSTNEAENAPEDYESGSKNFMALSDIASYLNSSYGSGYVRYIGLALGYSAIYTPDDLCVYYKNGSRAENNCVITSTFFCLQAMKYNNKLPNFPSNYSTTFTNIWTNECEAYQVEVDLYGKKCKYNMGYAYNFPVLYKEIRNWCSTQYWKIESLSGYQAEKLMEHMGDAFGEPRLNAYYSEDWQELSVEITKQILNDGMPSLLKIMYNGSYHTMPVLGYNIYEKKVKVLFWTTTKTVTFYRVFDENYQPVYFDITAYHGMGGAEVTWIE